MKLGTKNKMLLPPIMVAVCNFALCYGPFIAMNEPGGRLIFDNGIPTGINVSSPTYPVKIQFDFIAIDLLILFLTAASLALFLSTSDDSWRDEKARLGLNLLLCVVAIEAVLTVFQCIAHVQILGTGQATPFDVLCILASAILIWRLTLKKRHLHGAGIDSDVAFQTPFGTFND